MITWIARSLLGDSLPAIRFLPAVAGGGEVQQLVNEIWPQVKIWD
jgi:hypothetical protein